MKISRMLAALGALASACGGGTTGSSSGTSSDVGAVQAYQALGQEMSDCVATYKADTATLPDDGTCQTVHEGYATRMAAMFDRMVDMTATMDQHMAEYGHAVSRDMPCVAEVMEAELDRHHAAACVASDITADEAEAAAHVAAMTSLVEHQRVRYEDAGSMMGMMDAPSESTWTCQRNADGSFMIDGQTWTPGTPLPFADGQETPIEPQPWPMPCADGMHAGCDGSGGMGGRGMM